MKKILESNRSEGCCRLKLEFSQQFNSLMLSVCEIQSPPWPLSPCLCPLFSALLLLCSLLTTFIQLLQLSSWVRFLSHTRTFFPAQSPYFSFGLQDRRPSASRHIIAPFPSIHQFRKELGLGKWLRFGVNNLKSTVEGCHEHTLD